MESLPMLKYLHDRRERKKRHEEEIHEELLLPPVMSSWSKEAQ